MGSANLMKHHCYPKCRSILAKEESLARESSQKIPDLVDRDSTEFAKASIHVVEEKTERPANAAKSIYKVPGQIKNQKDERSDIRMLEHEIGCISVQDDHVANGYYFVILDDIALDLFFGPIFYHLCKAMKKVETVRDKKGARE